MRNFNSAHKKIEMFIGAWGVKTGDIVSGEHLLELASRLFEVENTGVESEMAVKIDALGRKERKRLAEKNLPSVFGSKPHEKTLPPPSAGITEAQLERMMAGSEPKVIDGDDLDIDGKLDVDPAQLLRKVVSAVISAGRADILWEFPEVLAFFGSRIPYRHEVAHLHNIDERQFEAKARWPNVRPDPGA